MQGGREVDGWNDNLSQDEDVQMVMRGDTLDLMQLKQNLELEDLLHEAGKDENEFKVVKI